VKARRGSVYRADNEIEGAVPTPETAQQLRRMAAARAPVIRHFDSPAHDA